MNTFSIKNSRKEYELFDFINDGKKIEDAPFCGMTLRKAGSMRFRWNETNPLRDKMLKKLSKELLGSLEEHLPEIVPLELIHSKIVYDVKTVEDTFQKQGDGIISVKEGLIPVVTVADCMPIYLYDRVTGVYGIVHSGWKGTGIAGEAIKLACKDYSSKPENFSVILGPNIHECCYIVDEERAMYFKNEFTPDCISSYNREKEKSIEWDNGDGKLYHLSLAKANIASLLKTGVREENINICTDCTCCNPVFGSNRRETSESKSFTVQAAFIALRPRHRP